MTTQMMPVTQAAPRTRLSQRFGGSVVIAGAEDDVYYDPAALKFVPEANEAVRRQCSAESLEAVYHSALDDDGLPAPGRMLMQFNRLTLPGGDNQRYWRWSDGSGAETSIIGVPIRLQPYRVLWGRETSKGTKAPSCGSVDDAYGFGVPGGSCAECAFAKYREGSERCAKKSRLYLATGKSGRLTMMDLTAMPRQGLVSLVKWATANRLVLPQLVIRFWLDKHPRPMSGARYTQLIVKWEPVGIADDRTDAYRAIVHNADQILAEAEEEWLYDIATSQNRGSGPASTGEIPAGGDWAGRNIDALPEARDLKYCPIDGNEVYDGGPCSACAERGPSGGRDDVDVNQLPF